MDLFFTLLNNWPVWLVGIAVLVYLSKTLVIVHEQTVGIVETLGRFTRVIDSGFHFVFFPLQKVAGHLSLKIESVSDTVEVKTSDNMFVALPVTLMMKVREDNAQDAFYKLHDAHDQVRSWVLNAVRSCSANMTLEDLFKDRERITDSVSRDLSVKLGGFGYQLDGVLVDQPTVDKSVQASFNRVVEALRLKEAAVAEAEAARIKTVNQAEAEADAQRARAKGLADSRMLLAEGMKASLDKFEGIAPEAALQMLLETNRIDALREVGKHGNLVLMDLKDGADTTRALLAMQVGERHPARHPATPTGQ